MNTGAIVSANALNVRFRQGEALRRPGGFLSAAAAFHRGRLAAARGVGLSSTGLPANPALASAASNAGKATLRAAPESTFSVARSNLKAAA